jgi:hypothetical protein
VASGEKRKKITQRTLRREKRTGLKTGHYKRRTKRKREASPLKG